MLDSNQGRLVICCCADGSEVIDYLIADVPDVGE